jgi:ATP-binding cassette, subfamily B, multidrug efflux pump
MSKTATAPATVAANGATATAATEAKPPARPYLSLDDRENDLGRGLNRESAARLLAFLRPYRAPCVLSLVAITIQTLGELALPRLLGVAIDSGIARNSVHTLFVAVGIFLGCVLVVFGARWTQGYTTTRIGNRVIFDLRYTLFQHIQILGFTTFDRMGVGRLISRVQNDVSVLQDLLTDGIIGLFADLLVLAGIIVAMLTINLELALLSYIVLPIMIAVVMIWRRFAIKVYRAVRAATSRLTGFSAENISGMRIIQSFRREQVNFARFERLNRNVYEVTTHSIRLNSVLGSAVELISGMATVIVLIVGGNAVIQGTLTIGALTAFIGYVARFFQPVRTLSDRYNTLQAATVAAERVFELLDEPPDIVDAPDATVLPRIDGRITFEDVTFGYGTTPVLRNIDLNIPPGTTVAFVGPTGAGKSSTINLVPRFYDVWDGRVLIDGHDVRDVTLTSLRSQFGIVLQDTFLFSATIAENIRYGKLGATDAEIEAAARAVGVHDFIAQLPDGYDSEVGERGSGLSVGQRQLIAFARVVLADPRIVVLDEATSSVDTQTEQIIQEALRTVLRGRTSLVIAHRLSTIVEADMIVVIDGGRIVERGNHAELMALRGQYHRLYTTALRHTNDGLGSMALLET